MFPSSYFLDAYVTFNVREKAISPFKEQFYMYMYIYISLYI